MKKFLFLSLLLLMMILSSCTSPSPGTDNNTNPVIADYFPLKGNILMDYEGIGNEYAEETTYVDYLTDDTIQIRAMNPGTTMAKVYRIENGELRMVYSLGEYYYLSDFTGLSNENTDVLLKEPLEVGTEWLSSDGQKRYISDTDKTIDTPAGSFETLVVTTEGDESTTYYYFAKDIGIVKKEFVSGEFTVTTTLKTIAENAQNEITINFYYPDFDNEKTGFTSKTISYSTNDNLISAFEDNFKSPPNDQLTAIMSNNTKINNMYLNMENSMAYIDFSPELVSDMNAGTSLEGLILQSIVNTMGSYYGIEKVYIYLDGKPYESGHFMLTEDTWFSPNYDNSYHIE